MEINSLLTPILAFISFILAIFPVIVIHEFGHFLVGRWLGAEPEVFSMGMGKRLFSFKWLDAEFRLSALPIGGYVKFKKVQFEQEFGEGDRSGSVKLSPWAWIPISLAGPVSNFILTFVIFTGFFIYGFSFLSNGEITSFKKESVLSGSTKIVFIKDEGTTTDLIKSQFLGNKESNIFYVKDGKMNPYLGTKESLDELVTYQTPTPYSLWHTTSRSLLISSNILVFMAGATADGIAKIFTTSDGYKGVMGPLGIATEAEKARKNGVVEFLFLVAGISFAIGFFNLLPLTFLDGGRVLIAFFEGVFRKSISMTTLGTLNLMSLIMVLALFSVGTFSDIMRIFKK